MQEQIKPQNKSKKSIQILNVASVSMQCDDSPSKNREKMIQFIKQIKKEHTNVDLIVFGESILGRFFKPGKTKEYHHEIAEIIPGETTNELSKLAKLENIYLTFGMSEREGDSIFNSQVFINPEGRIDAIHRKFLMRDSTFKPGNKLVTTTEIKGLKVGIVICFDIRSSKIRKALMKSNLDLVIHSMADDEDPNFFGAGFLSRYFGTWYITANRYGLEDNHFWNGYLFIADPLGRLQVKGANKEQYLFYELEIKTNESWFRKFTRKIFLKFSLIFHIIKNLRIALSYVTDSSKVRRRKRREQRKKRKDKIDD